MEITADKINSGQFEFQGHHVAIKRSARARYLKLSVTRFGEVRLILPQRTSTTLVQKFLSEQQDWLTKALSSVAKVAKLTIAPGSQLTILGKPYTLVFKSSSQHKLTCRIDEREQLIYFFGEELAKASRSKLRSALLAAIIKFARQQTLLSTRKFAAAGAVSFNKISIREQSTRWGSCSSRGNLSYNWKLLLAPLEVYEYVIAHEVAHLSEHNHSQKFWKFLERLYPNYRPARLWLKQNAHLLEVI